MSEVIELTIVPLEPTITIERANGEIDKYYTLSEINGLRLKVGDKVIQFTEGLGE